MENRIEEFFEGLEHYSVMVYSFRHGVNPQVAQYRIFENCSANVEEPVKLTTKGRTKVTSLAGSN